MQALSSRASPDAVNLEAPLASGPLDSCLIGIQVTLARRLANQHR